MCRRLEYLRFLFLFMCKPITDGIGIKAGAMSADRLAHRIGVGGKEERREMNELRRQWELCPNILTVFEPTLWGC